MHDFGPKEKELCMAARNQRAQLVPMMSSRAPADGFHTPVLLILLGGFFYVALNSLRLLPSLTSFARSAKVMVGMA